MSTNTTKKRRRFQGYRPTINPSKRHRDRLNQELENLSKLLPFQEEVIARLDKLSVLRLSVSYLRNKNYLKGVGQKKNSQTKEVLPPLALPSPKGIFSQLFNEAIDGFMIILTFNGTIFFISESVKAHLGYSQSQYLHQSLYSYIHDDDHDELRATLQEKVKQKIVEVTDDNEEIDEADYEMNSREFVIRMKSVLNSSSSDMYKPFKVTGYMRRLNYMLEDGPDQYALFAFCQPSRPSYSMLEIRMKSTLFCSKNRLDLTFLDMDARGKDVFGYSKKDIFGRSSYVMVHRSDLQHLRCKHTEIIHLGRTTTATFRLLSKSNDWTWICGYARVIYKNSKEDFVVTTNRLMSDEEGDAMLRVRDSEDIKSLGRIGLSRSGFNEEESIKLGFPIGPAYAVNAIEPRPMESLEYNVDAVIAGTVDHEDEKVVTDDLLTENPEELFDVSEELLKSSPENILDSPEGFSDAFDMSPSSLKDPVYPFNLGHDNGNPTTCASARSESISTMSDVSTMEQQIYAQLQRQQSSSSSASPCRPDGPIDRSREAKKNSLTHLAKSLNEMEVSPPNVVAPPTESNPYLEMVFMQNMQHSELPGTRPMSSPQGRSITDLSYNSPHQRAFTNFDGFMPNGSYFATPPNTTCEFKGPIPTFSSNTFSSGVRPGAAQFVQNPIDAAQDSFPNDFSTVGAKQVTGLNYSQYNIARAPNVTITVPDPNLQDLRNVVAANGRAETSPKYPFVSPLSPTLSWSNSQSQGNVSMDNVDAMALQGFGAGLSVSDQIQGITRQLMTIQQQHQFQQQQRQNSYQRAYYANEQLQYANTLQQGHNGLK